MVYITKAAAALGFGGHRPVSTRSLRRYVARRQTQPGFPWEGKFETREQVEDYFSGDRIICLLCGKAFRRLSLHVQVHGYTEIDYKEKYGLGRVRGLTCAETHKIVSENIKECCEKDRGRVLKNLEKGRKTKETNGCIYTPPPEFIRNETSARIAKINPEKVWSEQDAVIMIERISHGRTLQDVAQDPDMPKISWIFSMRKKHNYLNVLYKETVEKLPFFIQSKMDSLGERFEIACKELFDKGMSDKRAAEILGVTAMACNKRTKPWREAKRRSGLDNSQDP